MSFQPRVTISMIDTLEIKKQHRILSHTYSCKITLMDGRERSVNLEGSALYSLTSVLSLDKIRTMMDFKDLNAVLREEQTYGTYAVGGESLLTYHFNKDSSNQCSCVIL